MRFSTLVLTTVDVAVVVSSAVFMEINNTRFGTNRLEMSGWFLTTNARVAADLWLLAAWFLVLGGRFGRAAHELRRLRRRAIEAGEHVSEWSTITFRGHPYRYFQFVDKEFPTASNRLLALFAVGLQRLLLLSGLLHGNSVLCVHATSILLLVCLLCELPLTQSGDWILEDIVPIENENKRQ